MYLHIFLHSIEVIFTKSTHFSDIIMGQKIQISLARKMEHPASKCSKINVTCILPYIKKSAKFILVHLFVWIFFWKNMTLRIFRVFHKMIAVWTERNKNTIECCAKLTLNVVVSYKKKLSQKLKFFVEIERLHSNCQKFDEKLQSGFQT